MNVTDFINKYVHQCNEVAVSTRIPSLVLLAVAGFSSRWGKDSFSFNDISSGIKKLNTYSQASKYVNNYLKFFEILFSRDKDYYTIRSYIRMLRMALGYPEPVAFQNEVTSNRNEFLKKIYSIAQRLNIDPEWLMIVIYNESKFNPKAVNPYTKATGLIQFTPKTAQGLGTTVDELYKMNNLQQLDFVYKYFRTKAKNLYSLYDLYKFTFFPISLGKPGNWVFKSSDLAAETVARQNKIFDLNSDGVITVVEFENYLFNKYAFNLV